MMIIIIVNQKKDGYIVGNPLEGPKTMLEFRRSAEGER